MDNVADALRWVRDWQRRRRIPGVALVVTDRSQTLVTELSGVADRAGMRPLSPEQRWQIGSISKAFTSIAVLQMEAQGLLSVEDRLTDHLPWVSPQLNPDITLHHLMSHTAGLPGGSEWTPDSLLESAVQGIVGRPQPPGNRYHYSNPGYELLGDVVEAVSGRPIERHLEERVVRPMGMTAASGSVVARDRERDVRGHRPPRDDVLWTGQSEQAPDAFFPTCTADGAIVATPEDMAVYLRFLLSSGSDEVLGAEGFARLSGRHVSTGDGWYGYGLHTTEIAGRVTLGHSGGMVGMFADVQVDHAAGIGTCLLINGHADVSAANAYVLAVLCGLVPVEPKWPLPDRHDDTTENREHDRFAGLYRSYNPWMPTVRVIRQDGVLYLVDPVQGDESVLHPDGEAAFGVGHPQSPDVAEFDVAVNGAYQRLVISGCVYGRARREE
ncbi:MAG: serine hydrolase domain-containing protein [Actinomycetes bacterium]